MHEVRDQLGAVRRVNDFGVELHGVEMARLVGDGGERRILARRDDLKAFGQARDAVAVAHPDLIAGAGRPDLVEQRARRRNGQEGAPELAMVAAFDLAAELLGHRLLPIADAEHRDAGRKHDVRRSWASRPRSPTRDRPRG